MLEAKLKQSQVQIKSGCRLSEVFSGNSGAMENASSNNVSINNPADITIIIAYFIMVIGVGIWVSARPSGGQRESAANIVLGL